MKFPFFLLAFFFSTYITCHSQNHVLKRPVIGEKFSDFVLDSVENYPKKSISNNDFKNKWIILDFWGEFCSGCINRFPLIDSLQKKYQKDVQFILVTQTYQNPSTAILLYKKLRNKFQLTIPASFDQNFVRLVRPAGLPTVIVISPSGIVEAITHEVSEDDLRSLLAGRKPFLERVHLDGEKRPEDNYDLKIPLLIRNNGGDDTEFLYRSILTKWNPSIFPYMLIIENNRLEALGVDLKTLFKIAYIGKKCKSSAQKFTN